MNSRIPTVLALYNLGFLSEVQVIEWADEQLMKESESFDYISELSLKGPVKCIKYPELDFPRPRELSYIEEFSLRLVRLSENYDLEVENFVQWVAGASLGLDIKQREIHLGYLADHYFLECDDLAYAHTFLKTEMVELLPSCEKLANSIWQEIA
jgi:hypothetical protein